MAQLVLAGIRRLEVTNFANPKRLPRFADAEDLLGLIRNHAPIAHCLPEVGLSAIAINKTAGGGVPAAGTGEYYHRNPDISGMVAAENLAVLLDVMRFETGLDVDAVLKIGAMVERIVGWRLRSECLHTGRIGQKKAACQ